MTKRVFLIAATRLLHPEYLDEDWARTLELSATDAELLTEGAARTCYQSWDRPNKRTEKNADFVKHINEIQHFSVMEHASATFYITGVSRSFTHQLVRHRHFQYSQLSQRYVEHLDFVEPDAILDNPELHEVFADAIVSIQDAYRKLSDGLKQDVKGRKLVNQAARAILPNATETKILVTGNHRAWIEFLRKRLTPGADIEIRAVSQEILAELRVLAPNLYREFK